MLVIDLSRGVTPGGLSRALLSIEKQNFDFVIEKISECILTNEENKAKALDILKSLHENEKEKIDRQCDLTKKQMIQWAGQYETILEKVIQLAQIEQLSFQFFIYILSTIILLEKIEKTEKVCATILRIGTNSPVRSFAIFENERSIVDINGIEIPEILAAFIFVCLKPFIGIEFQDYSRVFEVADPSIPELKIKLFLRHDRMTGSDDQSDEIAVLETNIDDTTSEIIANAMADILSSGALDYTIVPVSMKKGRSAFQVQVLCNVCDSDVLTRQLLLNTSTFGVRKTVAQRIKLQRSVRELPTRFGMASIKDGYLDGKLVKSVPEFDDIIRLSRENGLPVYTIYNYIIGELNKPKQ